jgi:hypothetical protein
MMAEDNMCTIRLVRPSKYTDSIRTYNILLNGKIAGSVGNNSTLEIAAPAGATTIEARIDWGRSQPLTINTVAHQRNYWDPYFSIVDIGVRPLGELR